MRNLIEQHGAFIEIHAATPLKICESRDRKGLYAKARKGLIPEFTGIGDPCEAPEKTGNSHGYHRVDADAAAQEIILYLLREGYLELGNGQEKLIDD